MAPRYFTFRKNVPTLAGHVAAFVRGKGWYEKLVAPAKNAGAGKPPRERLALLMDELVAHEPQIHYAEVRPMRAVKLTKPSYPLTMDCSETVTCLYKWAGLHDPNNCGFDGSGYTGTLLQHGKPVAPASAKTGDLVVFGVFPGHHVCMVRTPGVDPLLFSHGQENGPRLLRLSEEQTAQPRPAQFRSFL